MMTKNDSPHPAQSETLDDPSQPQSRTFQARFPLRYLAIGLVALIVVASLVVWSLSPSLMAEEVAVRLEERLDLDWDFSEIKVDFDSVEMLGVEMSSPEGDVAATVERMVVRGDLLSIARQESGAIEAVEAEGAVLAADLDHPKAAERVAELRRLLDGEPSKEEESQAEESRGQSNLEKWLRLVDDEVTIDIEDARVELTEHQRTRTLLDVPESQIVRTGVMEFSSSGLAFHDGGTLDWSVESQLNEPEVVGVLTWEGLPMAQTLRLLPPLPITRSEQIYTSGQAQISASLDQPLKLSGHAEFTGLTVHIDRLAPHPVRDLGGRFDGTAVVDWQNSELNVTEARFSRHGVAARIKAQGSWNEEGWRMDFEAAMPETSCQSVIGAIPADLIGSFSQTRMGGDLAGQFSLRIDSQDPKATNLDIDIEDGCRFIAAPALGSPDRLRAPFHQVTRGHDGEIASPLTKIDPPLLSKIDPSLRLRELIPHII